MIGIPTAVMTVRWTTSTTGMKPSRSNDWKIVKQTAMSASTVTAIPRSRTTWRVTESIPKAAPIPAVATTTGIASTTLSAIVFAK